MESWEYGNNDSFGFFSSLPIYFINLQSISFQLNCFCYYVTDVLAASCFLLPNYLWEAKELCHSGFHFLGHCLTVKSLFHIA